jgi:hypothetical protein
MINPGDHRSHAVERNDAGGAGCAGADAGAPALLLQLELGQADLLPCQRRGLFGQLLDQLGSRPVFNTRGHVASRRWAFKAFVAS